MNHLLGIMKKLPLLTDPRQQPAQPNFKIRVPCQLHIKTSRISARARSTNAEGYAKPSYLLLRASLLLKGTLRGSPLCVSYQRAQIHADLGKVTPIRHTRARSLVRLRVGVINVHIGINIVRTRSRQYNTPLKMLI